MTSRALLWLDSENRSLGPTPSRYTGMMEIRRESYGAAIRLALVFSVMAAMLAITLDAVGDVSAIGLLAAVAVVGFVTSWVQTGRVWKAVPARTGHRITVLSQRQPIG